MIVLVDTNIYIDIFCKKDSFYQDSFEALNICIDLGDVIIPTSIFSDIFYTVRKSLGTEQSKFVLESIFDFAVVEDTKAVDVKRALKSEVKDYEDAILCMIAKRIGADYILTRNIKDFVNSPIQAISPKDFLENYKESIY